MAYQPRVTDSVLNARLTSTGAVLIEGPKACGKTETARQKAASEVLLDLDEAARAAGEVDPSLILEGPTPRLIDEWHLVPKVWNQVRRTVDARKEPGQFILTGSAVPADDETRHVGAGRITRILMRPMSLFESGHSTGEISLSALLNGYPARASETSLSIPRLVDRVCVGGWPGFQQLSTNDALVAVSAYLDEIRRVDVSRVDGVTRDPARVQKLMRALARNIATQAATSKIIADSVGDDHDEGVEGPLARNTVYDHMGALERLMIVEDQPPWAPHLRSRARLRTRSTRHFVDPSLAVAALGASPPKLLKDLNLFGFLFESLVIRDLRIYGQPNDAEVFHYRDSTELEVDAIVEARDGRWSAFEVKLGGEENIEEAAANLLTFAERIDTSKSGDPACLGVIIGTGYGYVRKDGVAVIPVGALAP
jgi:predicted AAA+ superfamily ATPase